MKTTETLPRATRLLPGPQETIQAEQIYSDLSFPTKDDSDRDLPYVVINAVSTLDGKISRNGKSSGIGSNVDRRVMRTIRSRCDAILVGAGTVRAEKVSFTIPEDLSIWRIDHSKTSQPIGVILSRTEDISSSGMLTDTLILNENVLRDQGRTSHDREIKARDYLYFLKSEHGVKTLLIEGGPTINHRFFEERLVNELFLTLPPKLYGGKENNLLNGGTLKDPTPRLDLISTYLCEQELFLRYSVRYGVSFR